MKIISLHLPEPYIKALDDLVNAKYYPNRAEAIRTAIRDLIVAEKLWTCSRCNSFYLPWNVYLGGDQKREVASLVCIECASKQFDFAGLLR